MVSHTTSMLLEPAQAVRNVMVPDVSPEPCAHSRHSCSGAHTREVHVLMPSPAPLAKAKIPRRISQASNPSQSCTQHLSTLYHDCSTRKIFPHCITGWVCRFSVWPVRAFA